MGDEAPFYAWFIKRNSAGERTVHVHMVEPGQASVDRTTSFGTTFATTPRKQRHEALKNDLARKFPKDRAAYTVNKTAYIKEVLTKARAVKLRK